MKGNTPIIRSISARITVWVLCAVYVLFSVGIVKATHLCMGREASVSYFTAKAEKCACSLFAKDKDNCCDDEHDLLKIEDSQKNLSSFSLTVPAFICVGEVYSLLIDSNMMAPRIDRFPAVLQPPPKALFKVHCSFVYYDDRSVA